MTGAAPARPGSWIAAAGAAAFVGIVALAAGDPAGWLLLVAAGTLAGFALGARGKSQIAAHRDWLAWQASGAAADRDRLARQAADLRGRLERQAARADRLARQASDLEDQRDRLAGQAASLRDQLERQAAAHRADVAELTEAVHAAWDAAAGTVAPRQAAGDQDRPEVAGLLADPMSGVRRLGAGSHT